MRIQPPFGSSLLCSIFEKDILEYFLQKSNVLYPKNDRHIIGKKYHPFERYFIKTS